MPVTAVDAKLILIADDDYDGRETVRALLAHEGYRIEEAVDGAEVIKAARRLMPDLIFVDLGLPNVDGWEATRHLKADEVTRDIPIVVLSGHVFQADRARATAAGCDEFLAKPCEMDEILAVVRRLIGPPVPAPS